MNITVAEAIRLREYDGFYSYDFVRGMMAAYDAHITGNQFPFARFLMDIFNAGRVDGIRSERIRKKARA